MRRWIVALRLPVAWFSSRRVSAQRTGRPVLRELGRDERVVAGAVLRPEAAAHELADDPNLVGRQAQLPGDLVPHAPDELGRDVDVEAVALPLADRLVGLHRVVEDGLGAELGLDDGIGLGEAALDVAALVLRGSISSCLRPTASSGSRTGSRTSHSTSISATASRAASKVSAATAATATPG